MEYELEEDERPYRIKKRNDRRMNIKRVNWLLGSYQQIRQSLKSSSKHFQKNKRVFK